MKKAILAIAAVLVLSGCTDPDGARRVLEDEGFSNIRTGGYAFFMCDTGKHGSDIYATQFAATGPTGRPVSGAVCKGWFKGSTVRFD